MMYRNGMYPQGAASGGRKQVVVVEPFVYSALHALIGKRVVIDTTRGSVSGIVADAKPDHVVIKEYDSTFLVRIQEVVWIMPES